MTLRSGPFRVALYLCFVALTAALNAPDARAQDDPSSVGQYVAPALEPQSEAEAAGVPLAGDFDPSAVASADELLRSAEEALTTLDYARSRELAQEAIERGGLSREELIRALRLIAVCSAQLGDDFAAAPALRKLFALAPELDIASRLAPERRSALLDARGFWSAHKNGFGFDVGYARRERHVVVHVRDALDWGRTVHLWSRFASRPYAKAARPVAREVVFPIEDIDPTEPLEVYAFVTDARGNVIMELASEREPQLFEPTEEELAAILRRDIRGGQVGSFARRLGELDGMVGVHGYVSLELKEVDDVPSFDLHHATAMIRADLHRAASVELALEWEHLGRGDNEFYLPHAFIDIAASEALILRGGFFEVPVGAFNEYLYPDFLRITGLAPLFSQSVVPALWSEVGLQLRGRFALARVTYLTYAAFVGNGLEQRDPDPEDGVVVEGGDLRAMRFNGRDRFHADKGFGGRLGLEVDDLDFGVSGYSGRYTIEAGRRLSIADIDMSYRGAWLTVRTEGAIVFQEVTDDTLHKYGLYALVAVRPFAYVEPYAQYDFVDLGRREQRALLGFALYPVPNERATRNLRLKSEAGYAFPQDGDRQFVWFFQLTTGF